MAAQLNGSVLKAFAILDLFVDPHAEITAGLVSEKLGLTGVTAHRFLKTLERAGALVPVQKGVYRLGFRLVDLGERATQAAQLGRALQPTLDAITDDMREASMATVFEADTVVCVARAMSGRQLSVDIRVGTRLEAYCTAHGKLWLAHMGEAALARYLDLVERVRFSPHTIVDRAGLLAELERIRRDGQAVNDGEREEGIRAVAVPLTTRGGRMVAGLSVFGPAIRMNDQVMADALRRLQRAAGDARAALYGQGDGSGGVTGLDDEGDD